MCAASPECQVVCNRGRAANLVRTMPCLTIKECGGGQRRERTKKLCPAEPMGRFTVGRDAVLAQTVCGTDGVLSASLRSYMACHQPFPCHPISLSHGGPQRQAGGHVACSTLAIKPLRSGVGV